MPGASLEFHAALAANVNEDTGGYRILGPSISGTRRLWQNYPPYIRAWITKHGGLTSKFIVLRGRELERMFHKC
jgi:hypothetical protein